MSKIEYRYLSNCYAGGQDFNIIVSDAKFETISYIDYKYRNTVSSYTNGQNNANNNGLGTNIANSIIICSYKTEDKNSLKQSITYTSWLESDNNNRYDADKDQLVEAPYTTTYTVQESVSYRDSGIYDLAVTDNYGHPIVLTPPFNDIDSKYFTSKIADGSVASHEISYRKVNYPTSYLTLSDDFAKQFDGVNDVVRDMDITYTPLVKQTYSYTLVNGKKEIDTKSTWKIGYVINPTNTKDWVVFDPNKETGQATWPNKITNPETQMYSHSLRFCDLVGDVAELQHKTDKNNKEDGSLGYLYDWINTLQQKVSQLMELNFILANNYNKNEHPTAPYSYIWTGSAEEYKNTWDKNNLPNNVTFLINQ